MLLSSFHRELSDVARKRYVEGRASHLHGVLADVMAKLARGKEAGAREWKGSTHALAELPVRDRGGAMGRPVRDAHRLHLPRSQGEARCRGDERLPRRQR